MVLLNPIRHFRKLLSAFALFAALPAVSGDTPDFVLFEHPLNDWPDAQATGWGVPVSSHEGFTLEAYFDGEPSLITGPANLVPVGVGAIGFDRSINYNVELDVSEHLDLTVSHSTSIGEVLGLGGVVFGSINGNTPDIVIIAGFVEDPQAFEPPLAQEVAEAPISFDAATGTLTIRYDQAIEESNRPVRTIHFANINAVPPGTTLSFRQGTPSGGGSGEGHGDGYGLNALLAAYEAPELSGRRPNVMIIFADDMSYYDSGPFGSPNVTTPNLDRLVEEGLWFTHSYSSASMCAPARHALYTGLYPVRSGGHPNHAHSLPGTLSLPHYLGLLDYRVALSGKEHVNPSVNYPFEYIAGDREGDRPDIALDRIESFITRDPDQPWCVVVASHEPHVPWVKGDRSVLDPDEFVLPPTLVDIPELRMALRDYYAEINYLDYQIGHLLQMLEDHDMVDNTLVIFFSEQGASVPFAKYFLSDAGVRTLGIARWPAAIEAGRVSDALVQYVDVVPTLVELAGGDPLHDLDGFSFADLLLGKVDHHRDYVFATQTSRGFSNGPAAFGVRMVADHRYKLIWNTHPERTFRSGVENRDYFQRWVEMAEEGDTFARERLGYYRNRPEWEFYDLHEDPFELENLVENPGHAERIDAMKAILRERMEQQGDQGRLTELAALNSRPQRAFENWLDDLYLPWLENDAWLRWEKYAQGDRTTVNAFDWIGELDVTHAPWVYSNVLEHYLHIPTHVVRADQIDGDGRIDLHGHWIFLPENGDWEDRLPGFDPSKPYYDRDGGFWLVPSGQANEQGRWFYSPIPLES